MKIRMSLCLMFILLLNQHNVLAATTKVNTFAMNKIQAASDEEENVFRKACTPAKAYLFKENNPNSLFLIDLWSSSLLVNGNQFTFAANHYLAHCVAGELYYHHFFDGDIMDETIFFHMINHLGERKLLNKAPHIGRAAMLSVDYENLKRFVTGTSTPDLSKTYTFRLESYLGDKNGKQFSQSYTTFTVINIRFAETAEEFDAEEHIEYYEAGLLY